MLDDGTIKKGERYYRSGKVLWVVKYQDKLFSKVLGTYPYYVKLDLKTGENSCTCPLGADCKHVAAALKAYERGFFFESFDEHAEIYPEATAMEFLAEVPELALGVTLKELMFALNTDESGSEFARLFRRALVLTRITKREEVIHILKEALDEYSRVFSDYELPSRLKHEMGLLEEEFQKGL